MQIDVNGTRLWFDVDGAPSVILSAVVVAIVGISTLAAGWHRMADAVGGVFVAAAWGAGMGAILVRWRGIENVGRRTAQFGGLSSSIPLVIGAVIGALGGLAYVIAAVDPLDVLLVLAERGGSPALFAVGVVITIGTSLLALGGLGFALRDIGFEPRAGGARRRRLALPLRINDGISRGSAHRPVSSPSTQAELGSGGGRTKACLAAATMKLADDPRS